MVSDDSIPVSLVLGSGGARGFAHIGVIKALHEDGRFKVCSVSGSSIGALIGGLYAAGKLDVYEEWVLKLSAADVWGLLDFSYTRNGLFKGDRLMRKLRDLVGEINIEDLDIAFTAVASDIERRREVWLDRGSLFQAIRASIAIPGFFTPVTRNGNTLVDGGLLSPLPIPPVQRSGTEQMIVVSLNGWEATDLVSGESLGRSPTEHPQNQDHQKQNVVQRGYNALKGLLDSDSNEEDADSAIDIMTKSLEAMQDRIARYQMAAYRPDTLIEIPVDACDMLDFHRAEEMISLGYQQMLQAIDTQHFPSVRAQHTSGGKPKIRTELEELEEQT